MDIDESLKILFSSTDGRLKDLSQLTKTGKNFVIACTALLMADDDNKFKVSSVADFILKSKNFGRSSVFAFLREFAKEKRIVTTAKPSPSPSSILPRPNVPDLDDTPKTTTKCVKWEEWMWPLILNHCGKSNAKGKKIHTLYSMRKTLNLSANAIQRRIKQEPLENQNAVSLQIT